MQKLEIDINNINDIIILCSRHWLLCNRFCNQHACNNLAGLITDAESTEMSSHVNLPYSMQYSQSIRV